jgi:hypothetical protein
VSVWIDCFFLHCQLSLSILTARDARHRYLFWLAWYNFVPTCAGSEVCAGRLNDHLHHEIVCFPSW